MDERLGVAHHGRNSKNTRKWAAAQAPIKVVYFSNPVRVHTTKSEFLALVQKLTGRNSDIADNIILENSHHHHQFDQQPPQTPPPPTDPDLPSAAEMFPFDMLGLELDGFAGCTASPFVYEPQLARSTHY